MWLEFTLVEEYDQKSAMGVRCLSWELFSKYFDKAATTLRSKALGAFLVNGHSFMAPVE